MPPAYKPAAGDAWPSCYAVLCCAGGMPIYASIDGRSSFTGGRAGTSIFGPLGDSDSDEDMGGLSASARVALQVLGGMAFSIVPYRVFDGVLGKSELLGHEGLSASSGVALLVCGHDILYHSLWLSSGPLGHAGTLGRL